MKRRWIILTLGILGMIIVSFMATRQSDQSISSNTILTLNRPLFIQPVSAASSQIGAYLDEEAGFSAYFQDQTGITINNTLRNVFRTIEIETEDYIIGSVPVPHYFEGEDAHVYVHVDGWVLAYYFNSDPLGKVIDMAAYSTSDELGTLKLTSVLSVVAGATGSPLTNIGYYDFRYPNATHVMLIGEYSGDGNRTFTVKLPSSYGFYNYGWAVINDCLPTNLSCNSTPYVTIDGTSLSNGCRYCYGNIASSLMLPEVTHTVRVEYGAWSDNHAVIMLIYRMP